MHIHAGGSVFLFREISGQNMKEQMCFHGIAWSLNTFFLFLQYHGRCKMGQNRIFQLVTVFGMKIDKRICFVSCKDN